MKRLFVFAAAAASLMAISCHKTYVVDEVNTPIGFSADLGKQTKAIMDDATYKTDHTFGVFAFALTGGTAWSTSAPLTNQVMNNVEIGKNADGKWREVSGKKYYWPNDSETKLSFFAYSPYSDELGVVPTFSAEKGIALASYTHNDYTGATAVDFMVAEDVKDMQYTVSNSGIVPTEFKHKMTQLNFVVKKAEGLGGATITLTSLKLKGINNQAGFNAADGWSSQAGSNDYAITLPSEGTDPKVITEAGISPEAVTMIPQTLVAGTQQFEIKYSIAGEGFANEDVTRTFNIRTDALDAWTSNMKVTYTLTVNMKEILFNPSVVAWTPTTDQDIEVPNVN